MSLTHGAVQTMAGSGDSGPDFQPTLQVIQVKQVQGPGSGPRYRTILSDGQHFVQGMLATQLCPLIQSGQLKENTVIQVEDFMNNSVQGRAVIILLKINIVNADAGQRLGNPVDFSKSGRAVTPPQQSAAQPMYNRTNAAAPQANAYSKPNNNNPYGQQASSNNNPYGGSSNNNPYGGASNNNPYGQSPNNPYGQASSGAPIVRNAAAGGSPFTPISQLNMYQNRWTIQARVTAKSDIRTWSNAKGEGQLFSVELLDSSGTDIRATFFREAVDKFYNMLEPNQVYSFSGGRLKVANMQWNTCKSNFEITFDQNAEIHLQNDSGEIQEQLYDFVKISQLEQTDAGQSVDILAVVKSVGEPATLIAKKSGNELTKCDLTLVDDTGTEISLTVWGERATQAPSQFANTPIVAFRHAKVSDYGGKSLSSSQTGAVIVNPNIPEAQQLQQWWNTSGQSTATRSLSTSSGGGGKMDSLADRKDVRAIKLEHLGMNPEKPDWLSFKATFSFIKKDKEGGAWYTACANADEPCKNRFKVTQTTDGNWFCDKCQGTFPNCVRRWIFSATVSDDTATTWVSLFNEQAEVLFDGATADDVYNRTMGDGAQDQDAYDSYFAKANHSEFIMKCKVKQEMVGDESRVKTSVYSLHPLDYVKESRDLLDAIAKF